VNIRFFSLLIFALLLSEAAYSFYIPTEDEVKRILQLCAAGSDSGVVGVLEGSFRVLREKGEASGSVGVVGKKFDFGAILNQTKDESIKLEAFRIYNSCIKSILQKDGDTGRRDKSEIDSANLIFQHLYINVINPPLDDPIFIVNDKDINAMLARDFSYENHKEYVFQGSPEQLNLVLGKNRIVVRYGKFKLENVLRITQKQLEEAKQYSDLTRILNSHSAPKVIAMNYFRGITTFCVQYAPDNEAIFLINGKDISRYVGIDSSTPFEKYYSFSGSPSKFNLVSGKNKLAVIYGNIKLEYSFSLADQNLIEAYNIYGY